jgi:cytochrome c oxidase accessory protein FixG
MAAFLALPWLRIGGHPVVLLDVVNRQFILFGRTFLATDGALLMLLLLSIFIGIVLVTALVGRGWCGWACPQTVYMEFLYRPLERLFEGKRERQIELDRKGANGGRVAKNLAFLFISVLLGNSFLSYFVGTDALLHWVVRPPGEHPAAFVVMGTVSLLTFFDFAFFREQMCTVVCPYARLQSVLLDRRSLVIGYDTKRGEPRKKGKPSPGAGDCIDCGACVAACPTGIDIRHGLQVECIACAQCVDACDSIMTRIKKPIGLVRYDAEESLESGKRGRLARPRVLVYAALLSVLLVALVVTASTTGAADVTLLRGIGAPYQVRDGLVTNQIRVKIRNRAEAPKRFRVELADGQDGTLVAPENPLDVPGGGQRSTSVFVRFSPSSLVLGKRPVRFSISDGEGFEKEVSYTLLGPTAAIGSSPEGAEP